MEWTEGCHRKDICEMISQDLPLSAQVTSIVFEPFCLEPVHVFLSHFHSILSASFPSPSHVVRLQSLLAPDRRAQTRSRSPEPRGAGLERSSRRCLFDGSPRSRYQCKSKWTRFSG